MMTSEQKQDKMESPELSKEIKQEAVVPNATNVAPMPVLSRLVPINMQQNGPIFVANPHQFMPTQIISGTNMKHSFVPIAPISNPTLPSTNMQQPSALLALQTQLLNARKVANPTSNPIIHPIPQQQQTTYYNHANPAYLPDNNKDEILNENWSAKIAYAATLSSVKY